MAEFEFPGDDEEPPDRIEPGSPSLESVVFVLLGALSTVAVILHLAVLFGAFG